MGLPEDLWIKSGDWSNYEAYVAGAIAARFPGISIIRNKKVVGAKSRTLRQIDILLETSGLIAVECKHYARKIHVKDVESFLGMMDDLGVRSGIMVAPNGYTKAAISRSENDPRKLHLQILPPDRLSEFQTLGAPIIWLDSHGFALHGPAGWVVDDELFNEPGGTLVSFYPLGHSIQTAARHAGFMYANILIKPTPSASLAEMAAPHEANIFAHHPSSTILIEHLKVKDKHKEDHTALLRTASLGATPFGVEMSLYIDFENVVLLLVMHAPPKEEAVHLRMLLSVSESVFAMNVKYTVCEIGYQS